MDNNDEIEKKYKVSEEELDEAFLGKEEGEENEENFVEESKKIKEQLSEESEQEDELTQENEEDSKKATEQEDEETTTDTAVTEEDTDKVTVGKMDDEEKPVKQKKKNTAFIVLLILFLLTIAGGVIGVKFLIIDKKDEEISEIKAEKELKENIIEKLGVDIDLFEKTLSITNEELDDASKDLENATNDLKKANSTLNFLLSVSSERLVSKYMIDSEDIGTYDLFSEGIDNDDYRLMIALRNSELKYSGDMEGYYIRLDYISLNKVYKELFGKEAPKKSITSKWCNTQIRLEYDDSLYGSTGGYKKDYYYDQDYSQEYCTYPRKTFAYSVGDYYTTSDGFEIEVRVATGEPKQKDGGYAYDIQLTNGETIEWGGPTCRTTGKEMVEENKANLPVYVFKFKESSEGKEKYYLDAIVKK